MNCSKVKKIISGVVCLVLSLISAREFILHKEISDLDIQIREAKFDRESAEHDLEMAKMTGDSRRVAELQARAVDANKELERLKEIRKQMTQ